MIGSCVIPMVVNFNIVVCKVSRNFSNPTPIAAKVFFVQIRQDVRIYRGKTCSNPMGVGLDRSRGRVYVYHYTVDKLARLIYSRDLLL